MPTTTTEIADGVHRISTWTPEVTPEGFSFNQFLLLADEPMLFHTGPKAMFPAVAEAVGRLLPLDRLRWISFGHVEGDECGAVDLWLEAAPRSQVVFNALGCDLTLDGLCARPPRAVEDGAVLDLGGKRARFLQTPHVPHGWEAQVLFEEVTGTLLCGDLCSHGGDGPALTSDDVVGPAMALERAFGATARGPATGATVRQLAELRPSTLAIMHGSSFQGDGRRALLELAAAYDELLVGA